MYDYLRIVVDDTDPLITYNGHWSAFDFSFSDLGNNGAVYLSTQHSTITAGSTLVLPFFGNSVQVYGTINVTSADDGIDPKWECYVDKVKQGRSNFTETPQNNYILCDIDSLSDGDHELVVNVTSSGQPFWLDSIHYTPAPGINLESSTVQIYSTDPMMVYTREWRQEGSTWLTQSNGSRFSYTFTGSTVTWYGRLLPNLGASPADATYSIDGAEPMKFTFGAPTGSNDTQYNERLFWVSDLAEDAHTLDVSYAGGEGQLPLTLDYLIISDSPPFPNPSSPWAPDLGLAKGVLIATVVTGVVTGLFLFCLGFYLLVWRKRRPLVSQEEEEGKLLVGPQ